LVSQEFHCYCFNNLLPLQHELKRRSPFKSELPLIGLAHLTGVTSFVEIAECVFTLFFVILFGMVSSG